MYGIARSLGTSWELLCWADDGLAFRRALAVDGELRVDAYAPKFKKRDEAETFLRSYPDGEGAIVVELRLCDHMTSFTEPVIS